MTQLRRKKHSLHKESKLHHCCKVICHRSLPLNHPAMYTNGLCERHFFLIDLPTIDDVNVDNYLTNESNEKQIEQTEKLDVPLCGDIRLTREVYDGRQWTIFQETIDHQMSSNVNTDQSMVMTGKDNQKTLSDILDLLSSYKTLIDDLKQRIQL
ncbi:unnamed protein product [Adineta ricciae]|uniref:Uncharacterized protein n=1 Tax=Adineta ricciae TaxID=249248 RepID=A0A816C3V5_ADIRI|nr:unnamed protein product [Adineta ricciae]